MKPSLKILLLSSVAAWVCACGDDNKSNAEPHITPQTIVAMANNTPPSGNSEPPRLPDGSNIIPSASDIYEIPENIKPQISVRPVRGDLRAVDIRNIDVRYDLIYQKGESSTLTGKLVNVDSLDFLRYRGKNVNDVVANLLSSGRGSLGGVSVIYDLLRIGNAGAKPMTCEVEVENGVFQGVMDCLDVRERRYRLMADISGGELHGGLILHDYGSRQENLMVELTTLKGQVHGNVTLRYPSTGKTAAVARFDRGQPASTQYKFYSDSSPAAIIPLNAQGQRNGMVYMYYPDGKIYFQGEYINGKQNGEFFLNKDDGSKYVAIWDHGVQVQDYVHINPPPPRPEEILAAVFKPETIGASIEDIEKKYNLRPDVFTNTHVYKLENGCVFDITHDNGQITSMEITLDMDGCQFPTDEITGLGRMGSTIRLNQLFYGARFGNPSINYYFDCLTTECESEGNHYFYVHYPMKTGNGQIEVLLYDAYEPSNALEKQWVLYSNDAPVAPPQTANEANCNQKKYRRGFEEFILDRRATRLAIGHNLLELSGPVIDCSQ